ncbi:sialidase family protein [soil metagenome]
MTLSLLCFTLMLAPSQPGVVIAHSPAKSKQYIGSPGLAVLPNGDYVASHDFFGPGSSRDTTTVYKSKDKGQTWTQIASMKRQWWSSLFVHNKALYLLGTTTEYGHTVIRRSTDNGRTWTEPNDAKTGLLLNDGAYHCAPMPVLIHNGRLWRGMEQYVGPVWGLGFQAFMLSAPVDADLLNAKNWTTSNRLGHDAKYLSGQFGGWLEGNAVITPLGSVVDILRVQQPGYPEKAAVVTVSDDGKTASFDPATGFIDLPGGGKKFAIRHDSKSNRYWTLTNAVPKEFEKPNPAKVRNTLALVSSANLKTWTVHKSVLQHPDVEKHGFQYVEWLFEGDDIIAAVRTAFDEPDGTQAHNAHDANYLLFVRVPKFR